jgi:hypothetical protein
MIFLRRALTRVRFNHKLMIPEPTFADGLYNIYARESATPQLVDSIQRILLKILGRL